MNKDEKATKLKEILAENPKYRKQILFEIAILCENSTLEKITLRLIECEATVEEIVQVLEKLKTPLVLIITVLRARHYSLEQIIKATKDIENISEMDIAKAFKEMGVSLDDMIEAFCAWEGSHMSYQAVTKLAIEIYDASIDSLGKILIKRITKIEDIIEILEWDDKFSIKDIIKMLQRQEVTTLTIAMALATKTYKLGDIFRTLSPEIAPVELARMAREMNFTLVGTYHAFRSGEGLALDNVECLAALYLPEGFNASIEEIEKLSPDHCNVTKEAIEITLKCVMNELELPLVISNKLQKVITD